MMCPVLCESCGDMEQELARMIAREALLLEEVERLNAIIRKGYAALVITRRLMDPGHPSSEMVAHNFNKMRDYLTGIPVQEQEDRA